MEQIRIRWSEITASIIIILCLLLWYVYRGNYDSEVVTSWHSNGRPLGVSSVTFLCVSWSTTTIGILFLFVILSRIEKYKPHSKKALRCYHLSVLATEVFFAIPYLATLFWNIGIKINPFSVIVAAFGSLFLFGAYLVSQTEKGWFIEIVSSANKTIWKRTHISVAVVLGIGGVFMLLFALIQGT